MDRSLRYPAERAGLFLIGEERFAQGCNMPERPESHGIMLIAQALEQ